MRAGLEPVSDDSRTGLRLATPTPSAKRFSEARDKAAKCAHMRRTARRRRSNVVSRLHKSLKNGAFPQKRRKRPNAASGWWAGQF
jgi:hypothetical protein